MRLIQSRGIPAHKCRWLITGGGLLLALIAVSCHHQGKKYHSFAEMYQDYKKNKQSSIRIIGDNLDELIRFTGKVSFNEEETAITGISGGGKLEFKRNSVELIAEDKGAGVIKYKLSDGDAVLADSLPPAGDVGKKVLQDCIREMIALGFDEPAHMERVYNKGGKRALQTDLDNIRADEVKMQYFNRLLTPDSVKTGVSKTIGGNKGAKNSRGNGKEKEREKDRENRVDTINVVNKAMLAEKIGTTLTSEADKEKLLGLFTDQDLSDLSTGQAWLKTVGQMISEEAKTSLLQYFIRGGRPSVSRLTEIHFIQLTDIVRALIAEQSKLLLYDSLIAHSMLGSQQWVTLISDAGRFIGERDKSDLLIRIAEKMPLNDSTRNACLEIAQGIISPVDKEKVLKAIKVSPEKQPH